MQSALTRIQLERERILACIVTQRTVVATSFAGLAVPIALVDRTLGAARYLRAHPVVLAALVAAVVVLRTRSVVGLLARGFGLWRIVRQLRTVTRRLGWW